jgi:poly(hydroxyalkanoate) depolymerase family esterase
MWRKLVHGMRLKSLAARPGVPRPRPATALTEFAFAPNPGNLRALASPPRAKAAPLVVVLHGCGQTAAGYDAGTGWSQLAAERGFAVLAMEQKAANNPGTCFSWFEAQDIRRGEGEVESIAAAIRQMIAAYALDGRRVFITGLSAGGAMTAAMLACYPEMFAGGAIIAGLPYGAALNVMDALAAMRTAPVRPAREWGDAVRAAASPTDGWPRVSIWHGDADSTVNIENAKAGAAQWADVHGLALDAAHEEKLGQALRLSWGEKLEVITVPGLGHGVPIDTADLGVAGPFILDVGLSSTRHIARFFGLLDTAQPKPRPKPVPAAPVAPSALPEIETVLMPHEPPPLEKRIENVILRALKAAGLLKKK